MSAATEKERKVIAAGMPSVLLAALGVAFGAFAAHGDGESAPAGRNVVVEGQVPTRSVFVAGGSLLADFGRDAFGWLEADIPEGEYVVRLGEKLDASGRIDMKPGGTIRAAETRLRTDGRGFTRIPLIPDERNTRGVNRTTHAYPIPEKFGVVMPFRYAEVLGLPAETSAISLRRQVLHWPIDMRSSSFVCSDGRLNEVHDFCKYSIWATSFTGVYVDGDRERIPYEADAYINQLGHYAIDADFEMGRRTFVFLMDHPTWPTEWAQHMIMMAWADWMYSGETNLVSMYFGRLKDEKLLLNLAREDGLLATCPDHSRADQGDIVDWPVGERDGFVFKPVNAVVNAFHYRNLREMRDIAFAIGKTEDAAFFADRADKVRESFDRAFYDAAKGLYADGEGAGHSSLHANAAALAFGLVPSDRKGRISDFLVSRGMACSVYFAQYLLEALFESGRAQEAISLMTADGDRSWLGMLAQGSTITMEAWSLKAKPNQDWNHAWGTPPLNVISRYVLGVKPLKPGFSEVAVSPQVGNLKLVEGRVPTPRGAISVRVVEGKVEFSAPESIAVQLTAK